MQLDNILERDDIPFDVKEDLRKLLREHRKLQKNYDKLHDEIVSGGRNQKKDLNRSNEESNKYIFQPEVTDSLRNDNEEKYRLLTERMKDVLWILDTGSMRFTYVSPSIQKLTGFAQEEVISAPIETTIPPTAAFNLKNLIKERAKNVLSGKYSTDRFYVNEMEQLCKDGSTIWTEVISNYYLNKKTGKVEIYGLTRDLTERRRIEESLSESEEKHRILFVNSPDAYLIIVNGIFIDCNRATEIMLHGDRSRIVGKSPEELSPEYQPDGLKSSVAAKERIEKALREGNITFEWIHRKFDGSDFTVEVSIGVMMLNRKKALFTTWRDITDRKKYEEAILESEIKYRNLVEQTTDGIFIVDEKGNYVDVNSGVCRMLGYSRDELLSMNMRQLVNPEDLPKQADTFNRMLAGDNVISERRLKCKNGTYVHAELNARMFSNKRFCAFVRDLSERKKTESEQIRLRNLEVLEQLISGITHDFRNLLTVIKGQAEILEVKCNNEITNKNISSIVEAAKSASRLMDQLMIFASKSIPAKTLTSIRDLIEEASNSVLAGSTIKVKYEYGDSCKIKVDREQIVRVLKNIIMNSLEAMPNSGELLIKTSDYKENQKRFTKITLRDSGVGISKENIDKIFNPYFSTKIRASEKGSGLGLSLSHSIIKNHNGKITIDSELGSGTTVDIYIPADYEE